MTTKSKETDRRTRPTLVESDDSSSRSRRSKLLLFVRSLFPPVDMVMVTVGVTNGKRGKEVAPEK
jgi:hypothetical protein